MLLQRYFATLFSAAHGLEEIVSVFEEHGEYKNGDTLFVRKGQLLLTAIKEAIELARYYGVQIKFIYNGTIITVVGSQDPQAVFDEWSARNIGHRG